MSAPSPMPEPAQGWGRRTGSYTDEARLRADVDKLLTRINADVPTQNILRTVPESARLLRSLAMLNTTGIAWYDEARAYEERGRRRLVRLTIGLSVSVLIGLVVLVTRRGESGALVDGSSAAAVLAAAFLGVVRIMASAANHQQKIVVFWRASSALKDRIYGFESVWNQHNDPGRRRALLDATGRPADELLDALLTEVSEARAIRRNEKEAFFATLRSPEDLLAMAESVLTRGASDARALVEGRRARDQETQADLPRSATRIDRERAAARRALEAAVQKQSTLDRLADEARSRVPQDRNAIDFPDLLTAASETARKAREGRFALAELESQVAELDAELVDARNRA